MSVPSDPSLNRLYLRSLLRLHLSISLVYLGWFLVVAIGLPLVFWQWPGIAGHRVLGVPIAWWTLGVVAYPILVLLGALYVRSVESAEEEYSELADQT